MNIDVVEESVTTSSMLKWRCQHFHVATQSRSKGGLSKQSGVSYCNDDIIISHFTISFVIHTRSLHTRAYITRSKLIKVSLGMKYGPDVHHL